MNNVRRGRPVGSIRRFGKADLLKIFNAINDGADTLADLAAVTGFSRHFLSRVAEPVGNGGVFWNDVSRAIGKKPDAKLIEFVADSSNGKRGRPAFKVRLTALGANLARVAKIEGVHPKAA